MVTRSPLLNSNNQAPSVQKVDSAIGLHTTNLYQGQEKIDSFASYIFILLNLPCFRWLGGRFFTLPADFLAVYFPLGLSGLFMPVFRIFLSVALGFLLVETVQVPLFRPLKNFFSFTCFPMSCNKILSRKGFPFISKFDFSELKRKASTSVFSKGYPQLYHKRYKRL